MVKVGLLLISALSPKSALGAFLEQLQLAELNILFPTLL